MTRTSWHRERQHPNRAIATASRRIVRQCGRGRVLRLEVLEDRTVPGFIGPTLYPTAAVPVAVAVADVNRDGIPDLVTADRDHGTVSVLLGNGDGSFQAHQDYAAGPKPDAVAAGDFNGDGIPDLAVVNNQQNGTVSMLLGNGDGSFRPPVSYAAGYYPTALAVGDFNGDGVPDLVVVDGGHVKPYLPGGLSVLLGNGDGSFRPPVFYNTGKYPPPVGVAVGDFRGNGIADLAAVFGNPGSVGNYVEILLGNGDGTFQAPVNYATFGRQSSIAVGDLRGNGIVDLVTANNLGAVAVLLGNGDGTFQTEKDYAGGPSPAGVTVGDLSGDGILDVVTTTLYATVSVLRGNGDGTFQSPITYGNEDSGSVVAADLRGRGTLDLVTPGGGDWVSVLLNNGDGSFPLAPVYPLSANTYPIRIAVADLRGNGINDLVTANEGGTVSVLLGNGDGSFEAPVTYPAGLDSIAVAVADLTGDGIPDIVVVNATSNGTVSVLRGNGDGTFQAPIAYDAGSEPITLAVADVNGDGIPDVVTAGFGLNGNGSVSVLRGNGDGSFRAPVVYPLSAIPRSVQVADLTGDGVPDIVTANEGNASSGVSVLLGNGDGTFGPPAYFDVGIAPFNVFVAVGDFRGNGTLDLAVAERPGGNTLGYVSVLLGNGDGTFQAPTIYSVSERPDSVTVADLSGDGTLDVITTDERGLWVLRGNGDGTLGPPTPYAGGYDVVGVAVGDLAGQGRADLAVTNFNGHAIRVMLNDGNWLVPGGGAPQRTQPDHGSQPMVGRGVGADLVTAGPTRPAPPVAWSTAPLTTRPSAAETHQRMGEQAAERLAVTGHEGDRRPARAFAHPDNLDEDMPDPLGSVSQGGPGSGSFNQGT